MRASDGGSISSAQLLTVNNNLWASAQGPGSLIDLSSLSSLVGKEASTSGYHSGISVQDGAQIRIPNLTTLRRAVFAVSEETDTDQITSVENCWIRIAGIHASLSRLTSLTNSDLRIFDGGTVDVSNVANIDGTSIRAESGGRIAFPKVENYKITGDRRNISFMFEAKGPGSVIDLSQLQRIATTPEHRNSYLTVRSIGGGHVNLSSVTDIDVAVFISSEGQGSETDITELSTLIGIPRSGFRSSIEALDGGLVRASQLTRLDKVRFTLDGNIEIAKLQYFTNGIFEVKSGIADLQELQELSGSQVRMQPNSVLSLPLVANIDDSSITNRSGNTLALPQITSFTLGRSTLLKADGIGSKIDLPNMISIVATDKTAWFTLRAIEGGEISLPSLSAVESRVTISADGPGTVVDLSNLQALSGYRINSDSLISATLGGQVVSPALKSLANVEIKVKQGIMGFPQLNSITAGGIYVHGGHMEFPSLETITDSYVNFQENATADFLAVTNINGTTLNAEGGSAITFPNVTAYKFSANNPGRNSASISVSGIGSVVDLSNVKNIIDPDRNLLGLHSAAGGQLLISGLTEIDALVRISSRDANSLVDLDRLVTWRSSHWNLHACLLADSSGRIRTPNMKSLDGVNLVIQGVIDVAQLESFVNGHITISNADADLTSITRLNHVTLSVGQNGTVQLDNVENIDNSSIINTSLTSLSFPLITKWDSGKSVQLTAEGAGSIIEFPNLVEINAPNSLAIRADDGGELLFDRLQAFDGEIRVFVGNTQSRIVLPSVMGQSSFPVGSWTYLT